MKYSLLVLALAGSLSACNSVEQATGRTPIIDTRGVDLAMYEYDLSECSVYANEVQVGRQTATAAATGAVAGGVIGAVIGNSDTAERAAGVGAVTGTVAGVNRGLNEREQVIKNCLRGRGYRVLN